MTDSLQERYTVERARKPWIVIENNGAARPPGIYHFDSREEMRCAAAWQKTHGANFSKTAGQSEQAAGPSLPCKPPKVLRPQPGRRPRFRLLANVYSTRRYIGVGSTVAITEDVQLGFGGPLPAAHGHWVKSKNPSAPAVKREE
jgi:hypothetical protein